MFPFRSIPRIYHKAMVKLTTFQVTKVLLYNNVTDLIQVLPGNRSVNTVQHATREEAVFSVSAVTSNNSR
jgi:hypothetical protein